MAYLMVFSHHFSGETKANNKPLSNQLKAWLRFCEGTSSLQQYCHANQPSLPKIKNNY
jgi:hypothetical protein